MVPMIQWVWSQVKMLALAAFLAFFCIRGFVFEPFRIPSRSMEDTLLIGDFLFVSKFAYGNRIPLTDHFLWQRDPQRGDIIVFKRTGTELPGSFFGVGDTLFIKRLVGLPGDRIAYRGATKELVINGEVVKVSEPKEAFATMRVRADGGRVVETAVAAERRTESLPGAEHSILWNTDEPGVDVAEMTVPKDMFVMMGDNRDNSRDSRFWDWPSWGFVPRSDLMGRAEFIWFSWDEHWAPRWERMGISLRSSGWAWFNNLLGKANEAGVAQSTEQKAVSGE